MKTIKGDLIKLGQTGYFDVIVHGSNCQCIMGAGIAKQIKQTFPEAYAADLKTIKGDKDKLGSFTSAKVKCKGHELTIVNAYTQFAIGHGLQTDYEAVRMVFHKIKEAFSGLKIGFPMIGCGLGGGNWGIIAQIIDEKLEGEDHTLVEWERK